MPEPPPDDGEALHRTAARLRQALAACGLPLSAEDQQVITAEGRAILASLTPAAPPPEPQPRMAFTFDDLPRIDGAGIQSLLRDLPFDILALALARATPRVERHFRRSMTQRRARILRDEATRLAEAATAEAIAAARERVVRAAIDLANVGQIVISVGCEVDDDHADAITDTQAAPPTRP